MDESGPCLYTRLQYIIAYHRLLLQRAHLSRIASDSLQCHLHVTLSRLPVEHYNRTRQPKQLFRHAHPRRAGSAPDNCVTSTI